MKKETVIKTLNDFPNEFDLEDFLERLVFIDKVEKGLQQANAGLTISHEQVMDEFREKWSK